MCDDLALGRGRRRSRARSGWLVRNKLVDRLGGAAAMQARRTGSKSSSTTISPASAFAATARRRASGGPCARAISWSSLATGAVVLDATAGSDAGIDVVSSEYATVAAEQTALERIVRRRRRPDRRAPRPVRGAHSAASETGSEGRQRQHRRARSTSPTRLSASICSTAPTKRSRARSASACWRALGASRRSSIAASALKADPALLADEAGAMSLFGGRARCGSSPPGTRSSPRSRRCSRRRRRKARWSPSPGRCARRRLCSSWPKRTRWRWRMPPTCPRDEEAERMVIEIGARARAARSRATVAARDRRGLRQRPGDRRARSWPNLRSIVGASPACPERTRPRRGRRGRRRHARGQCRCRLADLALARRT